MDRSDQIWSESPGVWTGEFGDEGVDWGTEPVGLENVDAYEACPDETLGTSTEQFAEHVEHVADRWLGQLDLPEQYGTDSPLAWLSERVDRNCGSGQFTEYGHHREVERGYTSIKRVVTALHRGTPGYGPSASCLRISCSRLGGQSVCSSKSN